MAELTIEEVLDLAFKDRLSLQGKDLSGLDLRVLFERSRFRGAMFSLIRPSSQVEEWKWHSLDSPSLRGCNLSNTNLSGIVLSRHKTMRSDKYGDGHWERLDMRGADLTGANLSFSNIFATLRSSKFRGSDLRGTDFRGSNLRKCDFTNANLAGANLAGGMLGDTTFVSSNLMFARIYDEEIPWGSSETELVGTSFRECKFVLTTQYGSDHKSFAADFPQAKIKFVSQNSIYQSQEWEALRRYSPKEVTYEYNGNVMSHDKGDEGPENWVYARNDGNIFSHFRGELNIGHDGAGVRHSAFPSTSIFYKYYEDANKSWNMSYKKLLEADMGDCVFYAVTDIPHGDDAEWQPRCMGSDSLEPFSLSPAVENSQLKLTTRSEVEEIIRSDSSSLVGMDLSGMDLSGLDFSYLNLKNTKFDDSDLSSAFFHMADLTGATLVNTNCKMTSFVGSVLTEANFQGSKLNLAEFQWAIFDNTNMSEADLIGTKLAFHDFRGMNFSGARIWNAYLSGSNFSTCNMRKVDMRIENTKLVCITVFNEADFSGAKLVFPNEYFRSRVPETGRGHMQHSHEYTSQEYTSQINESRYHFDERPDFSNTKLSNACLYGCLRNGNFLQAEVTGAVHDQEFDSFIVGEKNQSLIIEGFEPWIPKSRVVENTNAVSDTPPKAGSPIGTIMGILYFGGAILALALIIINVDCSRDDRERHCVEDYYGREACIDVKQNTDRQYSGN